MDITETACLSSFFDPTWTSWSTIWSAISALGIIFTVLAIRYAAKQLNFDAWIQIQEKWNDKHQVELRRALFERRETGDKAWTPEQTKDAKDVCGRMDEFARLVSKFADEKEVIEIWYDPISKLWDVLEEFVKNERKRVKHLSKWRGFETLARKCVKRRKSDEQNKILEMRSV